MPNLAIKDVPSAILEKLRQRASANHRSLQDELMVLLQRAAEEITAGHPNPRSLPSGELDIEEAYQSLRRRFPNGSGVPLARDTIRGERDSW